MRSVWSRGTNQPDDAIPQHPQATSAQDGKTTAATTLSTPSGGSHHRVVTDHAGVPGLLFVENFLGVEEEKALLAAVRQEPWDTTLRRRTQHYGWKFDYNTQQVTTDSFLGVLPDWSNALVDRMLSLKLVSQPPDQVHVCAACSVQCAVRVHVAVLYESLDPD